ncbi:MAG: hypothetical protein Q4E66_11725, partial [Comamonadaceae bacterium]|nr:hypothetical protein [Comamonadaceae bacterium]
MSTTKFDEGRLMQVLVAPIVSEKATMVAEKSNAVTFKVLQNATTTYDPETGYGTTTKYFQGSLESVYVTDPDGRYLELTTYWLG